MLLTKPEPPPPHLHMLGWITAELRLNYGSISIIKAPWRLIYTCSHPHLPPPQPARGVCRCQYLYSCTSKACKLVSTSIRPMTFSRKRNTSFLLIPPHPSISRCVSPWNSTFCVSNWTFVLALPRQYLYLCTSKASKSSTSPQSTIAASTFCVSICTFVLVKPSKGK